MNFDGSQQQQQQPLRYQQPNTLVTETQSHGVELLLQNLERLENTGDKLFESLALVGQGPPSLLAAQLVSMSQICQQMRDDAQTSSLQNVPVAMSDPTFSGPANALPRSQRVTNTEFKTNSDLGAWIQDSAGQTSELFIERRRLAANAQAALSVPSL
ncbi:hypothetical protein GGI08_008623 [Coemansia sp. S2]|nr:hypothetical protein H4S03_009382 [Coemansia sp. S3946]KAJ2036413.1 hypothetical protein GGI08_008623 [Coemansia sp. S2]KAJ2424610.1 hypothetical protein GGF41_002719 [Coemansia sp. RSA 2531]